MNKCTTYTLIKLAETTTSHGRIVTTIDFGNMITFHGNDFVHSQVACKWNL
jgi:hypothetical protein